MLAQVLGKFFGPRFKYDFIYPYNTTYGLSGWRHGEMEAWTGGFSSFHFAKFISSGDKHTVTVAAYANANWTGPFVGLPAANQHVVVRDIDYYLIESGRIVTNWCMVDVVDILQQVGYKLLPPAPLPNLGYKVPSAMDGLPAPLDEYAPKHFHTSAPGLPFYVPFWETYCGQVCAC